MSDMDRFMAQVQVCFPGAEVGEDNDGQLVIYTGLTEEVDGTVTPMEDQQ